METSTYAWSKGCICGPLVRLTRGVSCSGQVYLASARSIMKWAASPKCRELPDVMWGLWSLASWAGINSAECCGAIVSLMPSWYQDFPAKVSAKQGLLSIESISKIRRCTEGKTAIEQEACDYISSPSFCVQRGSLSSSGLEGCLTSLSAGLCLADWCNAIDVNLHAYCC